MGSYINCKIIDDLENAAKIESADIVDEEE